MMLFLSVQNWDRSPSLLFESEPYFKDQNRRIHTERRFDVADVNLLLNDNDFIDDVGRKIALGLFVRGRKNFSWAQIVYPHDRDGRPVLRIDEEPYEYKPHRRFCASLPLPTLNSIEAATNINLKKEIVSTILQYLPLHVTA